MFFGLFMLKRFGRTIGSNSISPLNQFRRNSRDVDLSVCSSLSNTRFSWIASEQQPIETTSLDQCKQCVKNVSAVEAIGGSFSLGSNGILISPNIQPFKSRLVSLLVACSSLLYLFCGTVIQSETRRDDGEHCVSVS